MKRTTLVGAAQLAATALVLLGAWSCSKDLKKVVLPNHRPEVRLTSAPIDTSGRYFYSITLNWVGNDPDGRVDHYLYAVDPPSAPDSDTAWVVTHENEKRLTFTASIPDPLAPKTRAIDPHVFVIKAVDNKNEAGPPVNRSFFSFTVAPTVAITSPSPSHLLTPVLTPSARFSWSGTDPDGVFSIKPVRYKYRLFSSSDVFPIGLAGSNPDSLRRYYAPAFAESLGWKSSSAETTTASFTNLTPGQTYMFVVVSFDEAGAYSPFFSRATNMLIFQVGYAGSLGPVITMFNEFFNFTYRSGGYLTGPSREVEVELPEGVQVTVNWFAEPPAGSDMRSYRWALDIVDLADETPRNNELTDLSHWSTRSLLTTSVKLGPFFVPVGDDATDHRLYIEAEDSNGLRSLGIVRFTIVKATFERPLLIVDDTRLKPDNRSTGTACEIALPTGGWPSAAEADTFLFARGGVPWACYNIPSPQGIFAGYDFDTLGTRRGRDLAFVPLKELVRHRRIVWIVDPNGAKFSRLGSDTREPMTALRYMTGPNKINTVSTFLRQGGLLWMVGGGAAYASMIAWNELTNDENTQVVSNATGRRELVPGRFMYDVVRWKSEIRLAATTVRPQITKYTGRFGDSADVRGISSPYDGLPPKMELKVSTDLDDPPPPGRRTSDYYSSSKQLEVLQAENHITEVVAPPAGEVAVVVSQVFAGGGMPGAAYKRDYVELRNRSSVVVNLAGWTLQYSTGGTAWNSIPLSGTIPAGRHFLVALASGTEGADLPNPDLSGTVDLALGGGKLALVKAAAVLDVVCPEGPDLQDIFGYGDVDCSEQRTFGRLNAQTAAFRRSRGCEDTGLNDSDFYAATPSPLNSDATARTCFEVPVLDTLYRVAASTLPGPDQAAHLAGMTYYHGSESPPVVFTGFDIWGFRRSQCVQLVDFVLGRLWGLQRSVTTAAAPRAASVERSRAAAPATPTLSAGRARPRPTLSPQAPGGSPARPKPRWPWSK